MYIFFILTLIFGLFLLVSYFVQKQKVKKIKLLLDQVVEYDVSVSKTSSDKAQDIIEKTDPLLKNIRLFNENVMLKILCTFATFLIAYGANEIFGLQMATSTLGIIGIFALIGFFLIPGFLQKMVLGSRIAKISKDIPMFVDLLAICVQSGMNIEMAIRFLESNISQINKQFAPFLKRIILKSEISGLEVAIEDLQKELPSTEISMMCTTLKQSLKYGSTIYETLMNLSMEIREMKLLETEEAIGKLSAKLSVPLILFFMFPIIIIIAAPGIMKALLSFN